MWLLKKAPSTTTKIECLQRLDNDCDSNFHYQVHINETHRETFNKNYKLIGGGGRGTIQFKSHDKDLSQSRCGFFCVCLSTWELIQYCDRELRCDDAVYCFKSLHTVIQYLPPIFNKTLRVKQQGCSNNCFSQICGTVADFVIPKYLKYNNTHQEQGEGRVRVLRIVGSKAEEDCLLSAESGSSSLKVQLSW